MAQQDQLFEGKFIVIPVGYGSSWYSRRGKAFRARHMQTGQIQDLDYAIVQHRTALELSSDDPLTRSVIYGELGHCFFTRYERLGEDEDLDITVNSYHSALHLTPDDHPQKYSWHDCVASSLRLRFERTGKTEDANLAVTHHQQAFALIPDGHPEKASVHNNLGNSLCARFIHLGDIEDLNNAIIHQQQAIDLTRSEGADLALSHHNLGNSLKTRYDHLDGVDDLHRAISHHQHAVSMSSPNHRYSLSFHSALGDALKARFHVLDEIGDLNQALSHHQLAVDLSPEKHYLKSRFHSKLGSSFQARFLRTDDAEDLDRSIFHHQQAVDLTLDGYSFKSTLESELGDALFLRYNIRGDIADVEQAIVHCRRALDKSPEQVPNHPSWHSTLGICLKARFQRLGRIDDLREAIVQIQIAVNLTQSSSPHMSAWYTNLGNCFLDRFRQIDDLEDLHQAISHLQQALDLTPDSNHNKAAIHNSIGNCFLSRFGRLNDLKDIQQAIIHQERALELTPLETSQRSLWHTNLGSSYQARYHRRGDTKDLHRSMIHFLNALKLPSLHFRLPLAHVNLAHALWMRSDLMHDNADRKQALFHLQQAVDLTQEGDSQEASRYTELSRLLSNFSEPNDLASAIHFCSTAAQLSHCPPGDRFTAAKLWVFLMYMRDKQLLSVFHAFETAVQLLPRLCWMAESPRTRFHRLHSAQTTSLDAGACAIATGRPKLAIEWLEQSRLVVWNQILQMRTPLDDLSQSHPLISGRLKHIWDILDGSENFEIVTTERLRLSQDLNALLLEIRRIPRFSRFLLPKEYSELRWASLSGPVVLLNASKYRCDALVLASPSDLCAIPLEGCQFEEILAIGHIFRCIIGGRDLRQADVTRAFGPSKSTQGDMFKDMLSYLWVNTVQPCVNYLLNKRPERSTGLLRIRWCMTGLFTFLPIHAAGNYEDRDFPSDSLANYAISSYVPTLSALLDRGNTPIPLLNPKILAVIQPTTPNQSSLPGTTEELEKIKINALKSQFVVDSLIGDEATVEKVVGSMIDYPIVHFACHGCQDFADPLNSGLLLHDERLSLQRLMHTKLPNAQLVFLSACQTAMGDEDHPDEAIHLAAGMLAAGFKSVIGTLWQIPDNAAPKIADLVYGRILKDGKLDNEKVAESLHYAVEELRRTSSDFMSWMPFIHIGS